MSCMEHECKDCGYIIFSNIFKPEKPCPNCGGLNFYSFYDEEI